MTISHAGNAPLALAPGIKIAVWYSSNAALKEGQAVCYNFDYGADATKFNGRRFNEVETPTTLNAQHFAGVAACAYAAVSSGQLIEIYLPGSVCNILCGVSTTLGVGLLTFDVTSSYVGQFRYMGIPGEGSAVPMQTTTFATNPHKVLAKLQVGSPSGGVEVQLAVNGALVFMVGGTTLITGDSIGGDCIETLEDGTIPGLRKKVNVITTDITGGNDMVLTVTNGVTDDIDDAVLATVTWVGGTALGQEVTLEWNGAWKCIGRTKTTPALA